MYKEAIYYVIYAYKNCFQSYNCLKVFFLGRAWYQTPKIPVFGQFIQRELTFKTVLCYKARPCQKRRMRSIAQSEEGFYLAWTRHCFPSPTLQKLKCGSTHR